MATATIIKDGKTSVDTRYFISSVTDVERFAYVVRKHWAIENQLHWCLDVIFGEDSSSARKDMSPLNLNVVIPLAQSNATPRSARGWPDVERVRFGVEIRL